jgi:hypothetical protein
MRTRTVSSSTAAGRATPCLQLIVSFIITKSEKMEEEEECLSCVV